MASIVHWMLIVLVAVTIGQTASAAAGERDYVQEGEYDQPIYLQDELREQAVAESNPPTLDNNHNESPDYDAEYGCVITKPGKSCHDIYQLNPSTHGNSRYYVILTTRPSFVYCNMELECGGERGWMMVANVSAQESCPSGWSRITSPVRGCRASSNEAGCYATHFSTRGISYRRICGMAVGYQKGTPDAFHPDVSINDPYLDGVSITYGFPRKHIWSYAVGYSENYNSRDNCPCSRYRGSLPQSFVYDHYYCESGANTRPRGGTYYTSDPLWDGEGCSSRDNCCAQPNMPWFYRQLPLTSHQDLEARICTNQGLDDEGVLVKELQLYVQ